MEEGFGQVAWQLTSLRFLSFFFAADRESRSRTRPITLYCARENTES